MTTEPLPDRWTTRDEPVLFAVARHLDAGEMSVDAEDLAAELAMDQPAVAQAMLALAEAKYLDVGVNRMMSGDVHANAHTLLERGRRTVGLWPNQDKAADALSELLAQAAEQADDEDDAGALRKAGRLLKSVPSDILADVMAALIRQQTGIG